MPNVSFTLDARRLYQDGVIENLAFDADRGALVLADWNLVEDDAAGCGFPYAQDALAGAVQIRKELTVDAPQAAAAALLIYMVKPVLPGDNSYEAALRIAVNGHDCGQARLKINWNTVAIDPAYLVAGRNEIVLAAAPGENPVHVPVALHETTVENEPWRRDDPPRSFKSSDGGRSWSPALGQDSAARGEYMIRLSLRQSAANGSYISPVFDLADVDGRQAVKSLLEIGTLTPTFDDETPSGTRLGYQVRSGATPVYCPQSWSTWACVFNRKPRTVRGRYFQLRVSLVSRDPLKSPAVRRLTFKAKVGKHRGAPAGGGQFTVEEVVNPVVGRSSVPFVYESLDHPMLRKLREKYQLEEVVRGAASELEALLRLRHWVSQQWHWCIPAPHYPEWDALEILEKLPTGESRGGFCGQYAIVLVQCCLALGYQARYVFGIQPGIGGGHEVVEVWSNELGKWILLDPNQDRHYLDRQTKVPLNAIEIQQSILKHFYQGEVLGDAAHNKPIFERRTFESFVEEGPILCHGGHNAGPPEGDHRRDHLMWGFPSLMPRSDFFARPRPMPKRHGFGLIWSWHGYMHWHDPQTPRRPQFAASTDRPSDFYWSLNQVHFTLEETIEAGVLKIITETNTPSLGAMLMSVDDGPWTPTPQVFQWQLSPGANLLRLRVRNTRGVLGMISQARVTWAKK